MESHNPPDRPRRCTKYAGRLTFFCFDTTADVSEASSDDAVRFRIRRLELDADTHLVDPTHERKYVLFSYNCVVEGSDICIPRSKLGSEPEFVRAITPHVYRDGRVQKRWRARMIKELTSAARRSLEEPAINRFEVCLRTMTVSKRSEHDEYFERLRRRRREVYHQYCPEFEPATEGTIKRKLKTVAQEELDTTRDDCCPICMGEYGSSEVVVTPCSHKYHRDCITQWLHMNHVCPMCRFKMPHDEMYHDPQVFDYCDSGEELGCYLLPSGGSSHDLDIFHCATISAPGRPDLT